MSTGQQQSGILIPEHLATEHLAAVHAKLAALQEERNGINQELAGLNMGLVAVSERIAANDAAQKLIVDELKAAGVALLGDTKPQALSQLPKPGQLLGTNLILITVREPVSRAGKKLGRALAFFGATENLPGNPRNFNGNAAAVGSLSNWHGANGWKHNRRSSGTSSYEEALFNALKDGSAIGKWTMPELALVNGKDRNFNTVSTNENMLAFNQDRTSPFYNSFVTISGSGVAKWSQSCTEHPDDESTVHTVRCLGGEVGWDCKASANDRSCVRPVVALELESIRLGI